MARSCSSMMSPTSSSSVPPALLAVHHHLVAATLLLLLLAGGCHGAPLKAHFYRRSCPAAEALVRDIVLARVAADPAALPAKLLRLFFHDCFVRGCDASVLIDSTPGRSAAEKDAAPNASLGGFDVIDTAKAVLEAVCPGTVSCADIVALAARDAVSFQFGRDLWDVQLGRRDGVVSRASEALANVPSPSDNFTALEARFAAKGLDVKDLVILSGAHTIGVAHCNTFAARLSGGSGPSSAAADPTLNAAYAAQLRARCGPDPAAAASNNATAVPMDPGSPARFDAHYYVNLKLGRGLFASDAALLADRRAAGMIHRLTRQAHFLQEFRNAVRKMGRVGVLTGERGEIRRDCRAVNSR
ncbi:hypothetical protein GQ55_3G423700 [Panicum hallii var. hallii]|uniref:Peroxidase n=1 Tax=Panicum hallii var. hallii TaxID=1504633 RepID=A0A2T7EHK4_9POAL|nr:hypothetical protein GQ55_3G423700 [Panicum hallii var. hallii]